jgi:hypothetical protein
MLLIGLTLSSAFTLATEAQTPNFRWAKRAGGAADEVGNGIGVDSVGNTYVAGYFKSTNLTFGATVLTNGGGADLFVVKYDFTGNVVWSKKAGGSTNDFANGSAVDAAGNAYVTGYSLSTNLSFSGIQVSNMGSADIFLAKYDSTGNLAWVRSAGGSGYDAGNAIAVDAAGNCYVAGFFYSSTAAFGGLVLTNGGQDNMFIAKYDSAGNAVWAKQAGGISFDLALAVAVDSAGNSFVSGNFFSSTASFGGNITLTNSGENDVFVAKYDPSGTALWARQVKGASDDYGYGLVADGAGNCYVTGTFFSSVATFATGLTLTNGGYNDIFLAKYDPAGTALWTRKAGGNSDDYSFALAIDSATNLYLAGNLYSTNATFGSLSLTNAGSHDIFIAKYNSAGTAQWVKRAGGNGADSAYALALDAGGNCHLTGLFASTNAAFGSTVLTNSGGNDLFVAQIDGDPPTLSYARAGNRFVVFWPTNQFGFGLESRPTFASSNNWSAATNQLVRSGSQFFATNTLPGNAFFRLRK